MQFNNYSSDDIVLSMRRNTLK